MHLLSKINVAGAMYKFFCQIFQISIRKIQDFSIFKRICALYLFFILFIQHLLSALFTNKYALMRYLINTLQNKAINNLNNNQF